MSKFGSEKTDLVSALELQDDVNLILQNLAEIEDQLVILHFEVKRACDRGK